ncbi:hypothetical protein TNIN_387701 [Trichonephila inaurata madagascariensis]|uniref:Uncharacterized protein n=1 Tax=Trichonephila inaurata madagascariensis TaxID=2747483 RepID=A0A8X6YFT3_9ARAC|nr:hypothetical protein TNIN_387701 [Trichonephila inaurata madagascariensis]
MQWVSAVINVQINNQLPVHLRTQYRILIARADRDRSDRVASSSSRQWRRVRSLMTQGAPKSTYESYSRSGGTPSWIVGHQS